MGFELPDFILTDAQFSKDRKYRYSLMRVWNCELPRINWIMLNPSTADENIEDPTVRKTIVLSNNWGFGAVFITNLFAFRDTNPNLLKLQTDPVGPENDERIINAIMVSKTVVCAWGNHGVYLDRSKHVMKKIKQEFPSRDFYCLKVNKNGEPSHPLYLPYKTKLQKYEPGSILGETL